MARVTLGQDDIDRGRIIPPGWNPIEVKDATQEQAGTDGSDLYVYQLRVFDGPNKGVIMRYQLSEKALGMGLDFFESMGIKVTAGVAFDPLSFKGKRADCYVQRGEYKGKPQNQPVQFRPLKGPAAEEAPLPKAQ